MSELTDALQNEIEPVQEYDNAPVTLADAIVRLARAEFLLEDLARAAELSEITKDTRLTNVYRLESEEYLVNKMVKKEDTRFANITPGENITIIG